MWLRVLGLTEVEGLLVNLEHVHDFQLFRGVDDTDYGLVMTTDDSVFGICHGRLDYCMARLDSIHEFLRSSHKDGVLVWNAVEPEDIPL